MKSVNIIYNEMKDLKENIEYLKGVKADFNDRFQKLLNEIRVTKFNAIEGVELYKSTQEFLQERRVLIVQLEELEEQYNALGGDERLAKLKEVQNYKRPKGKAPRKLTYYRNFKEKDRELISQMYHITT